MRGKWECQEEIGSIHVNRMPPSNKGRMNTWYATQNWGERPEGKEYMPYDPIYMIVKSREKQFYRDRNQKAFANGVGECLDVGGRGGHGRTWMVEMFILLIVVWLLEYI